MQLRYSRYLSVSRVLLCVFVSSLFLTACSDDEPQKTSTEATEKVVFDGVWGIDVDQSLQLPTADLDTLKSTRSGLEKMTVRIDTGAGVLSMEAEDRAPVSQDISFVSADSDGAEVYDQKQGKQLRLRPVDNDTIILEESGQSFVLKRK